MTTRQVIKNTPILVLGIALAVALSCRGKSAPSTTSGAAPTGVDDKVLLQLENAKNGLTIVLSEGRAQPERVAPSKLAKALPVDAKEARALLDRLPRLKSEAADQKSFALRDRSQPVPRTGETIQQSFPPKTTAAPPKTRVQELEVLRFAPEGDVPIAPHVSITFNSPMVAVTSHEEASKSVPAKLSPQPAGRWRWVGTKTLLFDPDVRMPMATRYQLEIAAGTRSADGATLKKATTFTFTTPAPTIVDRYPQEHEPQTTEPLMYLRFDQRIDPAAVLEKIRLVAGKSSFAVRAATEVEIDKDANVKRLIEHASKEDGDRRWLAFKPAAPLPYDSTVSVNVLAGTPSAEGPLTTPSEQSFHFKTFGPFRVVESHCSYGNQCPPGSGFSITFSNPVDLEVFDDDSVHIKPELLSRKIRVYDHGLYIEGLTMPRTSYVVTLPASLRDRFGQTLGKDRSLTFRMGDAEPQIFGHSGLVVADPKAQKATYDLHSINVKSVDVQIYKVTPKDWDTFMRFLRNNPREPQPAPGVKVFDKNIRIDGESDRMIETPIDLSAAMGTDGKGHAVVVIEPTHWPNRYKPQLQSWVQRTDIGIDAFVDSGELQAWTTDLATGKPLAGVELELTRTTRKARTSQEGLATIALDRLELVTNHHQLLIARNKGDVAFLPQSEAAWASTSGWRGHDPGHVAAWFVADDRQMYRPGETVHIKGWARDHDAREGGDIGPLRGSPELAYTLYGPRGNKLLEGKSRVSALGGFDFELALPGTPNLGYARVQLDLKGVPGLSNTSYNHSFQIQEFRRPEFEVEAKADSGVSIIGKGSDVTVKAEYYAGGPLPDAPVNWTVHALPATYAPPGWGEFTFGFWVPFWGWGPRGDIEDSGSEMSTFEAKTNSSGEHVLHMDYLAAKPPRPMSVVAQASVMDVNRQAWASQATILVHPSELYVGLRRDRYFVQQGDPIDIDVVIVDQDGKVQKDQKATVRAVRLDWTYENGEYKEVEEDPQTCTVESGDKPSRCSFATKIGGSYKITATVTDGVGRPNQTELRTWVSGGKQPPVRNVEQETITLIPDKQEYQAGDSAQILVQAPFTPAEGLLTIQRSGIVETRRFTMSASTQTLSVTVREGHVPNFYVQVDLVGAAPRVDDAGKPAADLPKRPAYAKGSLNLSVPPKQRTLQLTVTPEKPAIEPGGKTYLDIKVKDADDKAVSGAELAVIVVDESVLALSGYQTPDPLAAFYQQRPAGAADYHQRQYVKLARPEGSFMAPDRDGNAIPDGDDSAYRGGLMRDEAGPAEAVMTVSDSKRSRAPGAPAPKVAGAASAPAPAIAVRKNFDALAVFAPEVKTDGKGTARVAIQMPDNLTRYRVMVLAAAGTRQFGHGESNITARMPLMIRPSAPRFLNFGDRFELPVVVQNQTDKPMTVTVAVDAANATFTDGIGRKVEVAANDRVEVRFPAKAELAGTARFQVAGASGRYSDAQQFSLPVWTPATTEAFATYGEIDRGAIHQPVGLPGQVVTEFGGLEVTTSSTQLQALTDAMLYLVEYPFECTEQLSSRVLAVAALRDVLSAFEADGLPKAKEIEAAVRRDIDKLASLQNWDGGFAFWVRGHESWPYISIHAAHALARAKQKGFEVPEEMLNRSQRYLRDIEQHIPHYYSKRLRHTLTAYALFVRKQLGDPDIKEARALFERAGLAGLDFEALGWLISTLHGDASSKATLAKIHRHLDNKVTETAATAHWASSYSDGSHLILHSDRRADGVLLEALIEDMPKSDLIPKVVRGLLAHRQRGKWLNTQENVFILLAMDRYFQEFEKITPNFVARMWLGDGFAGEQRFVGRTTDYKHLDVPMAYLAQNDKARSLTIDKQGAGRLYYRIGMTYAPKNLKLEPSDHGFAVEREYEAVDDPTDVVRNADGTWTIRAGARVRVKLTMVAQARRYHVALVDPLPAGLEPMNPALAVTGAIPQDPNQKNDQYWFWRSTWYEHQNMRDERVEAFSSLLWEGVHEYSYVARATTPGRFIVPPSKAEEMYFPETFGRSSSDVVVVR